MIAMGTTMSRPSAVKAGESNSHGRRRSAAVRIAVAIRGRSVDPRVRSILTVSSVRTIRAHRLGRKDVSEGALERGVQLGHRDEDAEVVERRHAEPGVGTGLDPAGHDAREMLQRGIEVDGDAVVGDPTADPDADGRDLVLPAATPCHPDADAAVAPLGPDIEAGEGADDPFLEVVDEAA